MIETSPILSWLIFLPTLGALFVLLLPASRVALIRQTALAFTVGTFVLSLVAAGMFNWTAGGEYGKNVQLATNVMWMSSLNVHYYVGVDGLSLPLVLLTTAISLLACLASFSIEKNVKGYFALFLFLVTGMLGVFTSLDLMLFYVFFEVSLFPMYFLIGIWGGPRKEYAAIKFFLYTLLGSVGILIVILGIYHFTSLDGRPPCFDLIKLASPEINGMFTTGPALQFAGLAFWLLFIGFAV
ncbi:MAG: proton-conducting transporter membrane subunit, partial [Phycisphaerae bacterium]